MKHIKKFNEYEINEGLVSAFMKIISGASVIFNSIKKANFKDFSENMSFMNKVIDIVTFTKEQTWITEDYSLEERKKLASKYDIDNKYPTIGDIFSAKYKKEKKRDLNSDVDFAIKHLKKRKEDVTDEKTLATAKKILDVLEDLKNL